VRLGCCNGCCNQGAADFSRAETVELHPRDQAGAAWAKNQQRRPSTLQCPTSSVVQPTRDDKASASTADQSTGTNGAERANLGIGFNFDLILPRVVEWISMS
jgi:hypothetical protein